MREMGKKSCFKWIGMLCCCLVGLTNVSMGLYPDPAPLIDTADTVALWHFDTLVPSGSYILAPDDNSTGRTAHELRVVSGNLTTGAGGVFGEALVLDPNGGGDWGYNYHGAAWVGHETLQFDGLVNIDPVASWPDADPLGMIFEIEGVAWLRVICDKTAGTAKLEFNVWDVAGNYTTQNFLNVPTGQWVRIVAEYNNKAMSVSCGDRYESIAGPSRINQNAAAENIVIGMYHNYRNYFKGMLDEVRFSVPASTMVEMASPEILVDQSNAFCLWHMNDLVVSGSNYLSSDDNSSGRTYTLYSTPLTRNQQLDPHDAGTDLPASFGSSLVFDGVDDLGNSSGLNWSADSNNISAEVLFYVEPFISGQANGMIFEIRNVAWLRILWVSGSGGVVKPKLEFLAWDADAVVGTVTFDDIPTGQWVRVKAEYVMDVMTLQLNNHVKQLDRGKRLRKYANPVLMGYYHSGTSLFRGKLDEFMLTVPADPVCGYWGYNEADISGPDGIPDCYVDLWDFQYMASQWLSSTF